MYFPLFVGVLCLSLFCYSLLYVQSGFAIILKRKKELVTLLLLSYRCIVTMGVLWLFFAVPWVGLRCVIVVFPDRTHFLFNEDFEKRGMPVLVCVVHYATMDLFICVGFLDLLINPRFDQQWTMVQVTSRQTSQPIYMYSNGPLSAYQRNAI